MTARTFSLRLLLALFLTPFSVAQNQHAFLWTASGGMQDLGVPNGYTSSGASAINNLGEVAGFVFTADGSESAAIWTAANGWRILPSSETAFATAINDSGQVVGGSPVTNLEHAVLWTPGKGMQDLGTLGGSNSLAIGINNSGQVVGVSFLSLDLFDHAFSWTSAGGMQDLGTFSSFPNGMSWANSINNSGEIVGWATKATHGASVQEGVAVSNGGQVRELPIKLGTSHRAYAVNDVGQVVGTFALTKTETHGFSWTRTTGAIDLGLQPDSTGTTPLHVNVVGQIVGFSFFPTAERTIARAFLWTPTAGFQDLGTLGGATSDALGINNSGQVVGFSDVP